jgi:hypothetical protein
VKIRFFGPYGVTITMPTGASVTVAEAHLVLSAWLMAKTVTSCCAVTSAGAV